MRPVYSVSKEKITMDQNKKAVLMKRIEKTGRNLVKNNMEFYYADTKEDVCPIVKSLLKEGDVIKVTFNLENKGGMEADEVAQLYVHRKDAKVEWPEKELKAFKRLTLGAGESRQVTLEIPVSKLRYWNVDTNKWELEDGTIELMLGGASDDIRQTIQVKI